MLPRHDVAAARAARDFLFRVRHAAHLASGRKEDRLTFELQASLAQELGYRTGPEGEAGRGASCATTTWPPERCRQASDALLARAEEERTPRRSSGRSAGWGTSRSSADGSRVDDGELLAASRREVVRIFQLAGELGVPLYSWARERMRRGAARAGRARGTPEVVEALKSLFTSPGRPGRGPRRDARPRCAGRAGARVRAHHRAPPARPVPRVHRGRSHPARAAAPLRPARRRPGGRRARARRG